MEQVKAGDINVEQLVHLLGGIEAAPNEGGPPWVWIATVEQWTLDKWPGTDGKVRAYQAGTIATERAVKELVGRSEWGCVFTPEYEVRWRRMEPYAIGTCRVRVAGQAGTLPVPAGELFRQELVVEASGVERVYRLWGEHSDFTGQDWIELRIPHRLRYPLPPTRYAWLRVSLITDARGRIQYVRWRELTAQQNA